MQLMSLEASSVAPVCLLRAISEVIESVGHPDFDSSLFALAHRYTSSALTSDLAWMFGAGFAPLAALALSTRFGLIAAGAYLLSGAVATLLALWLNRELARPQAAS